MSVFEKIIIGVLIIVVGGMIVSNIQERSKSPHFIRVVSPINENEFCPIGLSFSTNEIPFSVTYRNVGEKETGLTVELISSPFKAEKNPISWYMEYKKSPEFKFILINNQSLLGQLNNFTIGLSAYYVGNTGLKVITDSLSCPYTKESRTYFKLIR